MLPVHSVADLTALCERLETGRKRVKGCGDTTLLGAIAYYSDEVNVCVVDSAGRLTRDRP